MYERKNSRSQIFFVKYLLVLKVFTTFAVFSLLSNPDSYLINERNGDLKGKGLEILMLEINPRQLKQRGKMVKVLENWFSAMGVEKFVVAETDANLTNTQTIIKNFLDN